MKLHYNFKLAAVILVLAMLLPMIPVLSASAAEEPVTKTETSATETEKTTNETELPAQEALFTVGTGGTRMTLTDALKSVGSSGKIILAQSGTLYGQHTIPSGVKIVVPYKAGDAGNFSEEPTESDAAIGSSQSAYLTLTLAPGATLTFNSGSALNVNGCVYGTSGAGFPTEKYGHIELSDTTSQIIMDGGKLYCYGYITGKGEVVVKNGATAYEMFQMSGWRGGSAAKAWGEKAGVIGNDKTIENFIFNDYAVQNVEANLTVETGATVKAIATVTVQEFTKQVTVDYIGEKAGLIQLGSNASITRSYTPSTNRMKYTMRGNVTVGSVNITIKFTDFWESIAASAVLGTSTLKMDSADYILAIPTYMDFVAAEGSTVTLNKNYKLLPGATLTVEEGGKAIVKGNLYIYDTVDYVGKGYVSGNSIPVRYVATTGATAGSLPKMNSSTPSGQVTVNGTLEINGAVFTTANGGTSVDKTIKGTGKIINNSTASSVVTNVLDEFKYNSETKEIVDHNITVVPVVGQIAGVSSATNYHSFAQGTYYGTDTGYWYSHVIATNTFSAIKEFKNLNPLVTAAVNRQRTVKQGDATILNVVGFVSDYLNITESGATTETTEFAFRTDAGIVLTPDENSTLTGENPYTLTVTNGYTMVSANVPQDSADHIYMRYDDHRDLSGKTVAIKDAGTPTSYQVGYGIDENTVNDTAVITLTDDGVLIATGIGTAIVQIDGVETIVTVTAAPISMLFLGGQSNMQGSRGEGKESIVIPEGMSYLTYGERHSMTTSNATKYAPSALTGDKRNINVKGTTDCLSMFPVNSLEAQVATHDTYGKDGPDSGFAYQWIQSTGEKVWIINAAHGGSAISSWQPGGDNYEEAKALFQACQETLRKEIAAGHYTLSHMGFYWCQGESDCTNTAEYYVTKFLNMYENFKVDLSADMDSNPDTPDQTIEFTNLILTFAGSLSAGDGYRFDASENLYVAGDNKGWHTYEELEMRGQRVAQLWLASNPAYPDINLVCNIADSWYTMPDGSNGGVAEYFQKHYPNGKIDYVTQTTTSDAWRTPTLPSHVRCTATDGAGRLHYNQRGFNEMGREAVRNTMYLLGYAQDPIDVKTEVTFYDWTGFREVSSLNAATTAQSSTLVVPVVYPIYRSKDVTYSVPVGATYKYYDLIADSTTSSGMLVANGAEGDAVELKSRPYGEFRWDLEDGTFISTGANDMTAHHESGSVSADGVFNNMLYRLDDSVVLKQDQNWLVEIKMVNTWTKTTTKLLANNGGARLGGDVAIAATKTGIVFSYVNSGNTHDNYGAGALMTEGDTTPHTFRLFNQVDATTGRNQIYVSIDGGELIAMDSFVNGQDYVINYIGTISSEYPLTGGSIEYIYIKESGASGNMHIHNWSEWTHSKQPTYDASGERTRSCNGCSMTEREEIPMLGLPTVYYWYLENDELVSYGKHGATFNALTDKVGSINNGVTANLQYKISTPIVLEYDKEWSVEWVMSGVTSSWQKLLATKSERANGDISIMFMTPTTLAVGNYTTTHHNYSANELSSSEINMAEEHKYRIVNVIDENGANLVHLFIDDTLIGVIDYDGYNKKDGVNFFNRDITFNYIGQTSYPLKGANISYIKVQLDDSDTYDVNFEHVWTDTPEWSWTGSDTAGYTKATATFTCDCGETQTIDAEVTVETQDPTANKAGYRKYTATVTVEGRSYTDTKTVEIPATGNDNTTGIIYRWELQGTELVSAPGYTENQLIKQTGTIDANTGIFTNVLYKLSTSLELKPEEEWVVEIKMINTWEKSVTKVLGNNGGKRKAGDSWIAATATSMCFSYIFQDAGSHKNIYSGSLMTSGDTTPHVFRIYNVVDEKTGDNQTYICMDDGTPTTYSFGTYSQNFQISYIGNEEYHLTKGSIEYIEIRLPEPDPIVNETYSWYMDETGLVSKDNLNLLTQLLGSVDENGKLQGVQYQLQSPIILNSDEDWILEFTMAIDEGQLKYQKLFAEKEKRANGDKAIMLHSTSFVFGEYNNGHKQYGVNGYSSKVTDMASMHKYRLENVVSADGSNMVYLYVDDQLIGPMSHPLNSGSSDWINGKSFVFRYLGQNEYPLSAITIGYIRVQESSDGHVHKYNSKTTAPTCTEAGYTTHTCIACGHSYTDSETAATNHSGGTATCEKQAECKVCGTAYGDLAAHTPGAEATCMTAQICTVCEEVLNEALDHDWSEWKQTKAPTCTEEGIQQRKCQFEGCVATEEEKISPKEHDPGENGHCTVCGDVTCAHNDTEKPVNSVAAKDPTCTEDGNKAYWHCTACGEYFKNAGCTDRYDKDEDDVYGWFIPAIKHAWSATTYNFAEDGKSCTATRVCTNDATHNETVTATSTSEVTTPATCTDKGITTYTATFNKDWAAQQTTTRVDVPALGHKTTLKPATEHNQSQLGNTAYYTCSGCDKYFSDENGATEIENNSWIIHHKDEDSDGYCDIETCKDLICTHATLTHNTGKDATCAEAGTVEHWSCNACGMKFKDAEKSETIDDVVIPKEAHAYGDAIYKWDTNTTPATMTVTLTCKNCEEGVEGHKLTATDTNVSSETVPGNCNTKSKVIYTGTVELNGKTYTETREVEGDFDKTKHNYTERDCTKTEVWTKCSICGEEQAGTRVERTYTVTVVDYLGRNTIHENVAYNAVLALTHSTSTVFELVGIGWQVGNDVASADQVWTAFDLTDPNTTALTVTEVVTATLKPGMMQMAVDYTDANSDRAMTVDLFISVDSLEEAYRPVVMLGNTPVTLEKIHDSIMMYYVSITLTSKQITQGGENVKITVDYPGVKLNGEEPDRVINSVLIAYEKALEKQLEGGNADASKQDAAINAMLNYGKTVQVYFGKTDPNEWGFAGFTSDEIKQMAVTTTLPNRDSVTENNITFKWIGANVRFDEEYSLRYEIELILPAGMTAENATATLIVGDGEGNVLGNPYEGLEVVPKGDAENPNRYYVTYPVPASDIAKEDTTVQMTINFSNGATITSPEFKYGMHAFLTYSIYLYTEGGEKVNVKEGEDAAAKTEQYVQMMASLLKLGESMLAMETASTAQQ